MNGNFDGGNGIYGAVLVGALAELGRLLNKSGQRQTGLPWQRVALMLMAVALPAALLVAGGFGS